MSYANLINQACTDKEEFFQRLRDFICKRNGTYDYSVTGIGWTLHDAVYATDEDNCAINDYFVIYSPGETGDDDLYIKISWINANIKCEGYQSWDSSAHTGSSNKYNTSNNMTLAEAWSSTLWIYGDLDGVLIAEELTTINKYSVMFGKAAPSWDDKSETVANCSSTLAAGSDVSITVDSVPANWAVGKELYIRTAHNDAMGTVKIEIITIKTLVGSTITADLTYSYTADSKLSDFIGYYCTNSTQILGAADVLIGENGTLDHSCTPTFIPFPITSYDPGPYEDKFFLLDFFLTSTTNGSPGKYRLVKKIPSFVAGFAVGDVIVEDDGTEWRCCQMYSADYLAVKEV